MSTPLNILHFRRGKDPDCSKCVRAIEPLFYLQKRGHQVTEVDFLFDADPRLTPEKVTQTLEACNIILITSIDVTPNSFELFKSIVSFCNRHRKVIVYDTDDCYVEVPDSNPLRHRTLPWDFLQEVIKLCHAVTVTGQVLQKVLSFYHRHVFILPNMIDFAKYRPRPRKHNRVRIGWAGGMTHVTDLALITDAVRTLQKKHHFEFFILGFAKEFVAVAEMARKNLISPQQMKDPFQREMVALAHHLHDIDYELISTVPYSDFPRMLEELDLDIGLCPIQESLFNRCRSAVKFYQYAAVQTATVASKVYPYTDEPVMLAENQPQAWIEALEPLILDAKTRAKVTDLQHQYVLQSRNYETNGIVWEVLYQKLIEFSKRTDQW
jgi:hypothetical protein